MAVASSVAAISAALLSTCAPDVAPETIRAVIQVESGGNVLALNINGSVELGREAVDEADAVLLARGAMEAGYSVDLGLMQVNSANLERLGVTVEEMFEPCANIQAGTAILTEAYLAAVEVHGPGQTALRAALSMYNTGSLEKGFRNGYVARYVGEPAISAGRPAGPNPYTAATLVFTTREGTMEGEIKHVEHDPIITTDLAALDTPGVVVEVDPDQAEQLGAFRETALSAEDAWDSNDDLAQVAEEPADGHK